MAQGSEVQVGVVIPAYNEEPVIAQTVRACKAIPGVDLIVVVDDGSTDDTQEVARQAGAATVRHTQNHGKASALETGANIVAMHDIEGEPGRLLLFLDGDLGESAAGATYLVEAVRSGECDCAIAISSGADTRSEYGQSLTTRIARAAVARYTGWRPRQPLSGQRCLTRAAYNGIGPLHQGWGIEVVMTIQLLLNGFRVAEIECDLAEAATGNHLRGMWNRFQQYRDLRLALWRLKIGGLVPHTAQPRPGVGGGDRQPATEQ